MIRVNVIGRMNGRGLERDLGILRRHLDGLGCAVTTIDIRKERGATRSVWVPCGDLPPADVSFTLETIVPAAVRAKINYFVPNLEWLHGYGWPDFAGYDGVLVKSRAALDLAHAAGVPARYLGFSSDDRRAAGIACHRTFLHVAGDSPLKGTEALLGLWRTRPEWPGLTVVARGTGVETAPKLTLPNLTLIDEYVSEAGLTRLMNEHRFHLAPSQTEGWGHSIVEGLSTGAVVVTVDADPMNDHVDGSGITVPAVRQGSQGYAPLWQVDRAGLADAVTRCLAMEPAELRRRATRARERYEAHDAGFRERLRRLVLGEPPG